MKKIIQVLNSIPWVRCASGNVCICISTVIFICCYSCKVNNNHIPIERELKWGEKRFTHIRRIHSVSNQLSSSCICIFFVCIFVCVCICICVCICMCICFCICICSVFLSVLVFVFFSVFVCVFVFVIQCVWGAHPHLYIRRIHSVRNQVSSPPLQRC